MTMPPSAPADSRLASRRVGGGHDPRGARARLTGSSKAEILGSPEGLKVNERSRNSAGRRLGHRLRGTGVPLVLCLWLLPAGAQPTSPKSPPAPPPPPPCPPPPHPPPAPLRAPPPPPHPLRSPPPHPVPGSPDHFPAFPPPRKGLRPRTSARLAPRSRAISSRRGRHGTRTPRAISTSRRCRRRYGPVADLGSRAR